MFKREINTGYIRRDIRDTAAISLTKLRIKVISLESRVERLERELEKHRKKH